VEAVDTTQLICPRCRRLVDNLGEVEVICGNCKIVMVDVAEFFKKKFPESDDPNRKKTKLRVKK
jgi:hypothetical protein